VSVGARADAITNVSSVATQEPAIAACVVETDSN